MKYGTGKYGTGKYGAYLTIIAKVKSSSWLRGDIVYLRNFIATISVNIRSNRSSTKNVNIFISTRNTIKRAIARLFSISSKIKTIRTFNVAKTIKAKVKTFSQALKRASKILLSRIKARNTDFKEISKQIILSIRAIQNRISNTYATITTKARTKGEVAKLTQRITAMVVAPTIIAKRLIGKAVSVVLKGIGYVYRYFQLFPRLSFKEYLVRLLTKTYDIKIGVIGMPIAGSTITLRAEFPTSAGELTELREVKMRVYAPGKKLIKEADAVMMETGVYTAQYTIPDDKLGIFDYEFTGKLGDKTITGRSSFTSIWK